MGEPQPIRKLEMEGMEMRKAISVALALGLLVGAFVGTAEAGKKKKKPVRIEEVIEVPYQGGNIGIASPAFTGGACFVDPTMPFSCKSATPTQAGMKFIKIEVVDATGQKAGGFISQQDNDGDGLDDGYGQFCGAHEEAVPLELEGGPVAISLYAGVCADGSSPSIVTSGTIIATFSNMP